jgi:hypothetical protein
MSPASNRLPENPSKSGDLGTDVVNAGKNILKIALFPVSKSLEMLVSMLDTKANRVESMPKAASGKALETQEVAKNSILQRRNLAQEIKLQAA